VILFAGMRLAIEQAVMSEHFLEEQIKRIRDLSEQIARVRPLHEVDYSQRYDSDDEEPASPVASSRRSARLKGSRSFSFLRSRSRARSRQ
jgi:hypothetical protein